MNAQSLTNSQTLLIIFVAVSAVAVLMQAVVLIGIFVSLRKAARTMTESVDDLKATVIPMIHSTREVLERVTPQVVMISQGLAQLTDTVQRESAHVKFSAAEIVERVNRQTERLDAMLTHGLNAIERTGGVLESAVAAPVRQANGIMAAIRAIVDTYRSVDPHRGHEGYRRTNGKNVDDVRVVDNGATTPKSYVI